MSRFLEWAIAGYFQFLVLLMLAVWLGFPAIFLLDLALGLVGVRLDLAGHFLSVVGDLYNLLQAPFSYTTAYILSALVAIPVVLVFLVRAGLDETWS